MTADSVDEIWIATGPEMTRVMFLAGDVVVEIWHDFAAAPSRIGEVHQLKIDQAFAGQNRATARLEDGTPVSLRLTPRDRPQPGQRITATIIGAPRQDKPWQGVVGARLVGAHVVLLPGDQGLHASRALPDASFKPLSASLAEKLPPGFGAILRRGVAGQDAFVVADELMMLVQLWHDRMQANGRLHDGGTLAQKAALHAPGANMCIEGDALPTENSRPPMPRPLMQQRVPASIWHPVVEFGLSRHRPLSPLILIVVLAGLRLSCVRHPR
jgi:hypothetical protein